MEAQLISILGNVAGISGVLAVIIWLVVYTLKEVQQGRVRDREAEALRITHLEKKSADAEKKSADLTKEVEDLTAEVRTLTGDLRKARTENNTKDLEIVRLRTALIRNGWEETINEH